MKAATEIREKEAADFAAGEKDLTTVIDMLQRAIAVLEKELRGASLAMMMTTRVHPMPPCTRATAVESSTP